MHMYYASRISGAAAIAALLAAGFFSIERARADFDFRRQSSGEVARAVQMEPGNADYLMFRALQIEYDGGDPRPLLERAARLNPWSSAPRIRLGLDAEVRGDDSSAEKWLLEAARIDRQFEPRWTLANFYFRRENPAEFWKWMRAALEISYGDRRPAFELCWQMSGDAKEIFTRAMPRRREVLAAYLGWLLETHRVDASVPVAIALASDRDERGLVLASVDALLESHDQRDALGLWQAAGLRAPNGIYRGNFEGGAIADGFDWRWNEISGVVHADIDEPRTMHRISFDGRQPASCEVLRQMVVLEKNARYRLRWNAAISQMESPTGLEWRIGDARAAVSDGAGMIEFIAPPDVAELKLVYERPSGEVRAEGSVEFWGVAIERR